LPVVNPLQNYVSLVAFKYQTRKKSLNFFKGRYARAVDHLAVRNVAQDKNDGELTSSLLHRVRKRLYPFFIFFSRCPVCGEWCKLHWLLL